jgi:ABC-type taurine transport system ATPase subunit
MVLRQAARTAREMVQRRGIARAMAVSPRSAFLDSDPPDE